MVTKGKPTKTTPEKKAIPANWRETFIASLRELPVVSAACAKANVSRSFAYDHRNAEEDFAKEWDDALEVGLNCLEDAAIDRALRLSDTLMIFLLKAHNPNKYRDNSTVNLKIDLTKLSDEELRRLADGGTP